MGPVPPVTHHSGNRISRQNKLKRHARQSTPLSAPVANRRKGHVDRYLVILPVKQTRLRSGRVCLTIKRKAPFPQGRGLGDGRLIASTGREKKERETTHK